MRRQDKEKTLKVYKVSIQNGHYGTIDTGKGLENYLLMGLGWERSCMFLNSSQNSDTKLNDYQWYYILL